MIHEPAAVIVEFDFPQEVLFDEVELRTQLNAAIDAAPRRLGPLEMVSWALC